VKSTRVAAGVGGLAAFCLAAATAAAHFQLLLPSRDIESGRGDRRIHVSLVFTHPMEDGPVMDMGRPRQFGVLVAGRKQDLAEGLRVRRMDNGAAAWEADYTVQRPGDHVFYVEPAPYWEPAERKMIVHYTKAVVGAMGREDGWDAMVGFPVEIRPLVRPYGLWTGNVFRGVVLRDGKPVPFAEIEVEYYNEGGRVKAPADPFITQVIKADAEGVFCYAMPRAGWWGFAALVDGGEKMKNPEGEMVDVELGGLMWVRAVDMD